MRPRAAGAGWVRDRQALRHLSKHRREGAQGKGLTMARKAKANPGDGLVAPGETGKLEVEKRTDEKIGRTLARITLDPQTRNANLAKIGRATWRERVCQDG